MWRLSLAFVLGLFASNLHAGVLPEGYAIEGQLSPVVVYSVSSARIVSQEELRQICVGNVPCNNLSAIVEVTANVEGNICWSEPRGVATLTRHRSWAAQEYIAEVKLMAWSESDVYAPIPRGCSAFSAPRNITFSYKVNFSLVKTGEVHRAITAIPTGYSGPQEYQVIVTYPFNESATIEVVAPATN